MRDILSTKKNDIFATVLNIFASQGFLAAPLSALPKGSREDQKPSACEDGWLRIKTCLFFLMILWIWYISNKCIQMTYNMTSWSSRILACGLSLLMAWISLRLFTCSKLEIKKEENCIKMYQKYHVHYQSLIKLKHSCCYACTVYVIKYF